MSLARPSSSFPNHIGALLLSARYSRLHSKLITCIIPTTNSLNQWEIQQITEMGTEGREF